jgi:hypothetical protein
MITATNQQADGEKLIDPDDVEGLGAPGRIFNNALRPDQGEVITYTARRCASI